ncbi:hypothetical protein INT43_007025 [Umbelopsis isabellina]|uniref:Uncharacterized protein n=1 Tax=Mortierella isabellina TaxID=91625 RepID=A0A8H7PYF1_MORIS|nr:hypothetical protein INT43_007025 [Umbelopsis isabellina]
MKVVDNVSINLEAPKSIDDVNQYLNGTMDMISLMHKNLQGSVNKNLMQTIDIISKNLQYAAELSPLISGKAEFADMYVSCCKKLIKYKGEANLVLESEASLKNASEILLISYRMEHTFLGLVGQSRHAAIYFRVLASMLWLFGIMKQIASNNPTNITSMLVSIIERINVIQRFVEFFGTFEQDDFKLIDLTDLRTNLVKACNYPSSAKFSALYSFVRVNGYRKSARTDSQRLFGSLTRLVGLQSYTPIGLDLKNSLKRTCARITLPISNSDKPIKFSSNLPLKIHIEAQLEFVDYINSIAIMVILPDKSTRQFWPSHHNFKPTTPYCYVLVTDIELDVELWTDIGMLQIHIVKWFEADLPGIDNYILRYPTSSMSHHDFDGTSSTSSLRLCEALNYYISPTKDH